MTTNLITGSGMDGRVTCYDILAAVELDEPGDDMLLRSDLTRSMNAGAGGRPSDLARNLAAEYRRDPAAYRVRALAAEARASEARSAERWY